MLNKPKQGNSFIEFIEELMNVVIRYDDGIKKNNKSGRIAGVKVEGEKISNNGTKKQSYSEAFRTWSGHNKVIYTHPPKECIDVHKENTTR